MTSWAVPAPDDRPVEPEPAASAVAPDGRVDEAGPDVEPGDDAGPANGPGAPVADGSTDGIASGDESSGLADEVIAEGEAGEPDAPWWAEPVEIDPDALPTMRQLDALSAELDEIDAALATMDTRAITSSGSSGRDGGQRRP